jgi:hypothetical protein
VPAVVGYPGAALAEASASRINGATGSTGVPTDRSTMPPGCDLASAVASARVSQGNSGNRADTAEADRRSVRRLSRLRLGAEGP